MYFIAFLVFRNFENLGKIKKKKKKKSDRPTPEMNIPERPYLKILSPKGQHNHFCLFGFFGLIIRV